MDDVKPGSTYDLPDAYDRDRIVLIARDPFCLFTYWEISNNRINDFFNELGHELWEKSVPVLKVTNVSRNTFYYITINDLANNWYINVENDNCLYTVEFGRMVSSKFFISIELSNYALTPRHNMSTTKSAYFADYKEVRKGNFSYETCEIYSSYNLNNYYSAAFGISSMSLFQRDNQSSIYGKSSEEFIYKDFKNND